MLLLLGLFAALAVGLFWFLQQPVFGRYPEGKRLARIRHSPDFRDGAFQNLIPTQMQAEGVGYTDLLKGMFTERSPDASPSFKLPVIKQDLAELNPSGPARVIWFGHSSYLLLISDKKILVDPVFSDRTSPISFIGTKRFKGTESYNPQDIPPVDLVILTHDHYDHLDYATIRQWQDQPGPKGAVQFITSLGVGETLENWGISSNRITELDWWEKASPLPGFDLTAVPARHFSGRALKRNQSLWSGFVIETGRQRILAGGDSGYGPHFQAIGEHFGGFDLVFLECGQYNEMWPSIHMMPEETVQAAIDLKANALFPVHWGKYSLAFHAWDEPIRRCSVEASAKNMKLITPKMGETVVLNSYPTFSKWWEKIP
jgi:L-ascorbate metabolism protein UlaG (beta-lactamase superfamily)